ncbi:MAG TPA: ABC transporter substrate-binding protein [Gammaproteobacteria bacterium]|nr:ABC transporter substrate-binding protein [Gammaproteobacteria bacterium]HIM04475.1 ABC transporter substrate-binding protein [Gammaproteobacteria bacterium]
MNIKQLLSSAGVALVVSLAGASAHAGEITVASWGGSFQAAQSKAIFQPVAKAMGITINEESYKGIGQVRTKVAAGAVPWDIIDTGAGGGARGCQEGILIDLDYDIIDVSNFIPGTYLSCCVGTITYSTVPAWNTETYGMNGPRGWADFWDVKKFPGTRSIRGKMHGMLEPALMADGVPMDQIYKVLSSEAGITRALDKIRELKPHVAVWWGSGAQHAQLMKDGEVDMSTGWNGRFDVAKADGAKVAYHYDQALLDYDCFGIPKGAPNTDLAMKALAEFSKPEFQADMPKYINYGPTNSLAYTMGKMSDEVVAGLPSSPANAAVQLLIGASGGFEWYAKWEKLASEMYQDMMTE